MWKITNTAFDRAKTHLHRVAAKFDPEPYFNGRRLRSGQTMEISDELFLRCEKQLRDWERAGIIIIQNSTVGAEGAKVITEAPNLPSVAKTPLPPVPVDPPFLDDLAAGTAELDAGLGRTTEQVKASLEERMTETRTESPQAETSDPTTEGHPRKKHKKNF